MDELFDGELRSSPNAFQVALPSFEGPLDLLLHLIREHKLDIFDIPIALITEKYVEHLDKMREVNLDIAGEFLVMASTLAHIKSRLLLPRQEAQGEIDQPEQGDPRADLVRRLLEYQKYKHAAQQLASHDLLDRNVFVRRVAMEPVPRAADDLGLVEVSIFKLIEALDQVLKNAAPEIQHEVVLDRVTISESIQRIADRLRAAGGPVSFFTLFDGQKTRQRIVVTFLGLLEMCKLRLVRVRQEGEEILVEARGTALADAAPTEAQDEYQ